MTDDEKRAAIEALVDAQPDMDDDCPASEFVARVRSMGDRIRAILDDVPSVEWGERTGVMLDDGWRLRAWQADDDTWSVAVNREGFGVSAWGLSDRDSAKARALALYVALRGVT